MPKIKFGQALIRDVRVQAGEAVAEVVIALRVPALTEWWGRDIEAVEVTWRDHEAPPVGVDLAGVRARFRLAQMAGTDADDAGRGWDVAKMGALTRSWNDVAVLADEVARLRRERDER